MKKIKKLMLNKEVVSILGGNDMNLVKGGVYTQDGGSTCYTCGGNGGNACPNDAIPQNNVTQNATCPLSCKGTCNTCNFSCNGSCNGNTCPQLNNGGGGGKSADWSCNGSCFEDDSCFPCSDHAE